LTRLLLPLLPLLLILMLLLLFVGPLLRSNGILRRVSEGRLPENFVAGAIALLRIERRKTSN
jgi:hypothetical protein